MIGRSDILQASLLIVDDQAASVLLLEQMLREAGYVAITSTTDPHAVCALHRQNHYDLILLDLQMPGLDGFQVMEDLKEIETGGYLPVLVITALPGQKLRALQAGARDFVSKPLELAEVLIRVSNLLEVRLLHREAERRTRQAEIGVQEIRASELRYRRLFESAKDGILILDAETGMVDDVNPFLITLLGFSREQFLGKAIWDLGFFKDIVANAEKFVELQQKEYVRYDNLPMETSDGRRIAVEFVSNVYLVNGGRVIQCNVRDITARRKAEDAVRQLSASLEQRVVERTAQLQAANQELDAFSYSVSHDLRAPLRAMDGFSQLVIEDFGPLLTPVGQRYLENISRGAQQMGALIDDLLAFSRLSRLALAKGPVNVAQLVQDALETLASQQAGRALELHVGELPGCTGDPALLKQVWVNLLSNALKYTRNRNPAIVDVGCTQQEGENVYFVRDNGAGFDPRYADKLFGVFQRLHRAEDYEGTGVGLAIVQRIVHRHGGRVWAEAAVERGATFYFTLGEEASP